VYELSIPAPSEGKIYPVTREEGVANLSKSRERPYVIVVVQELASSL